MLLTVMRHKEADLQAKNAESLLIQAVRDKEMADSSTFAAIEQRDIADSSARVASQRVEEVYSRIKNVEDRRLKAEEVAAEAVQMQNQALEQTDSVKRINMLSDENARGCCGTEK